MRVFWAGCALLQLSYGESVICGSV
jgi:hypothetical protein